MNAAQELRRALSLEAELTPAIIDRVVERVTDAGVLPMSDVVDGVVPLDPRGPGVTPFLGDVPTILLDSLGTALMATRPSDEVGIYLEIGGRLNRSSERNLTTYLLALGQAGELVASILVAAERAGVRPLLDLTAAMRRERERIDAVHAEHHG